MKKTRGFTLIELLVVIAIIIILAGILFVRYSAVQRKARDSKRKADIKEIQTALEMYADDHDGLVFNTGGGNPLDNSDVVSVALTGGKYISRIPEDPRGADWDMQYYNYNSQDGKLYSILAKLENENEQETEGCINTWNCNGGNFSSATIRWDISPGPTGEGIYFRVGNQ